jgi:hypothetical protein
MRRRFALLVVVALAAFTMPACLVVPGDTSQIALVSSSTANDWRYDYYRNSAYRCAISGFQTFVVGTRVGSSATLSAPLWVWMHGGGVGWFDASHTPQPDSSQMTEETAASLQSGLTNPGLLTSVRNSPALFRVLAVSYCDRDLYSGTGQNDVNNPNMQGAHLTNGLQATKAAIQFVEAMYPTSKYFLHGGSAGSAGAYYAGYAMQQSGNPPAGVIGDASVVNVYQGTAAYQQGVCTNPAYSPSAAAVIAQRVDPAIADSNSEIDKMIARGEYTVPLLHIWNHGDTNTCGSTPMQCPLRNNTVVTMGATDCNHQPLQAAIDAQGPTSPSKNLPLCVDNDPTPDCSLAPRSRWGSGPTGRFGRGEPTSPVSWVTER